MSKDREYGLFKDGNYYGLVSYPKGQQIMTEQEKKGCDVCHSKEVIVIMSPGWKPQPPPLYNLRPGGIPYFIKSFDEFK